MMEFQGHRVGLWHFRILEGKGGGGEGGGGNTWKPSVVGYGHFLELPKTQLLL